MLQVSEAAAIFLKEAIVQSDAPNDAAVRLEPRVDRPDTLGISFRDEPEAGDDIVEESGLRVFVAPEVSEALSDRTLDVASTQNGVGLTVR